MASRVIRRHHCTSRIAITTLNCYCAFNVYIKHTLLNWCVLLFDLFCAFFEGFSYFMCKIISSFFSVLQLKFYFSIYLSFFPFCCHEAHFFVITIYSLNFNQSNLNPKPIQQTTKTIFCLILICHQYC